MSLPLVCIIQEGRGHQLTDSPISQKVIHYAEWIQQGSHSQHYLLNAYLCPECLIWIILHTPSTPKRELLMLSHFTYEKIESKRI